MTPPPATRRPVRAVLALTVGAASLVGLGQAAAAPPVTYAVTGVSPAYVEAGVDDAFGVTLAGKGFTRKTRVHFTPCGKDGTTVAPTTVTAAKLVVRPPNCEAGPQDITVTEGTATTPTSTLRARFRFVPTPVVEAVAPATTAVLPDSGSWSGGSAATVTVKDDLLAKAVVQVRFTRDGVTRAVPGKVDPGNLKRIAFKVPPGVPGGRPEVAVSVFGILSERVPDLFTYRSTIRTSPAVWVKGAPAPAVKVDGAGFAAGPVAVTVCGVEAARVAGKPLTDRTVFVTPPSWEQVAAAGVDATEGGVCTVRVAVTGGETSVLTAGSTFTYAAY